MAIRADLGLLLHRATATRPRRAAIAFIAIVGGVWLCCWLAIMGLHNLQGNVPVRLYGRLIDADGRPVAEATVRVRVTQTKLTSGPFFPRYRHRHIYTVTDRDGYFQFDGGRAHRLTIDGLRARAFPNPAFVRDGPERIWRYPYRPITYPPGYGDNYLRPDDPDDPVVFTVVNDPVWSLRMRHVE